MNVDVKNRVSRDLWRLAAIMGLALAARGAVLWAVGDLNALWGDGRTYYEQSVRLFEGQGYDHDRPPGYSAVLALSYRIAGTGPSVGVM